MDDRIHRAAERQRRGDDFAAALKACGYHADVERCRTGIDGSGMIDVDTLVVREHPFELCYARAGSEPPTTEY